MDKRQPNALPSGSKLWKGATLLAAAAIISKLLGTLQKIPMQNLAGDQTYGIYSTVYPFYILIMFLATAGFPIAVSKFVSERVAQDNLYGARKVLYVSSFILTITGCIAFVFLYFGAGFIAGLMGNQHTKLAIQSVSFAVLFVPIMSALRGYFQGFQDMLPTAISQVIEQLVRVGTMLVLLEYFMLHGYSNDYVAAGATFGSVTGAMAGLLVMLWYWSREAKGTYARKAQEPFFQLAGKIVLFAIPICLGAIVVPILNIVDSFTMPRLLASDGLDELGAMEQIGIYSRGLILVQLVSMLASSISVALVPAIAEARVRGEWPSIGIISELSIRITWLVGLAASVGLALTALPVNVLLYKNDAGTATMAILAFTALFSTLNIISASILQGLGSVLAPAVNLLIAAVVKISLNMLLMPTWGINGAAVATVTAFLVACVLNLIVLHSQARTAFSLQKYVFRAGAAVIIMAVSVLLFIFGTRWVIDLLPLEFSYRMTHSMIALFSVTGGAIVFGAALFLVGAVTQSDLDRVPSLGKRIAPILYRFKLIRGR